SACGGLLLRRRVLISNTFALAWLIVGAINPTDWSTPGCQLSFLNVALVYWVARRWTVAEEDPLKQLEEESRPPWQRRARALGWAVGRTYALSFAVWLAAAPLVATRYNTMSPIAVLVMAPLMVMAAAALVVGFLLLL